MAQCRCPELRRSYAVQPLQRPHKASSRSAYCKESTRAGLCQSSSTRQSRATSLISHVLRQRAGPSRTAARASAEVLDKPTEVTSTSTKLPVTILTGFLGSGKTTLLNKILRNKGGKRVAVIENEFGAIDIDSELVALRERGSDDSQPDYIMTLDNGCACCTVNENFVQILLTLIDRRDEFDQMVIETTGLANPHSIINSITGIQEVLDHMDIDAVVTLVDAKHVERQLDEKKAPGVDNEAMQQIAYADRIILNKTDLVKESDLQRLEKRIHAINSFAHIRRASQADVSMDFVLGLDAFDASRMQASELEATSSSHDHGHDHSHHHQDHGHAHAHEHEHHNHEHDHHPHTPGVEDHLTHVQPHQHDDSIRSFAISQPGLLDPVRLDQWMMRLMGAQGLLYRYKGILAVEDKEQGNFWLVFQGVHDIANVTQKPMEDGAEPISKMVFIGKDLDEQAVRQSFDACLTS